MVNSIKSFLKVDEHPTRKKSFVHISTDGFKWYGRNHPKKKNVICRIVYRQHNSPENFLKHIEEAVEKYSAAGKNLCFLGDFNLCPQKIETCHYSHEFLLALQSCYLIPTIDKFPSIIPIWRGILNVACMLKIKIGHHAKF